MSSSGPKEPSPPGPASPEPEQRRGRGRPRKHRPVSGEEPVGPPTPKRPRGRPKGSRNKGPKTPLKIVEAAGERRRRGRPRKWLQKLVEEGSEEQKVQSEEGGPERSSPQEEGQ